MSDLPVVYGVKAILKKLEKKASLRYESVTVAKPVHYSYQLKCEATARMAGSFNWVYQC